MAAKFAAQSTLPNTPAAARAEHDRRADPVRVDARRRRVLVASPDL